MLVQLLPPYAKMKRERGGEEERARERGWGKFVAGGAET